MIVQKHLKWTLILRNSARFVIAVAAYSAVILALYQWVGIEFLSIPSEVVVSLGIALIIFLIYNNNASHNRWWEAQKIWGGIVNNSRSWGRMVLTMITLDYLPEEIPTRTLLRHQRELIYRHIAWVNALRLQLRGQEVMSEIDPWLAKLDYEKLKGATNIAVQLNVIQGISINRLFQHKYTEDFRYIRFDKTLNELTILQTKAEAIKNRPNARQNSYFTKAILGIWVMLLPLGLIKPLVNSGLSLWLVPSCIFISWVFFAMNKVGQLSENPFDNNFTDTPMTTMCKAIEIELLEMLGEKEIPEKLEPVDGFLY